MMTRQDRGVLPDHDPFLDVAETLQTVRQHLDMDWAYLSEFTDNGVVFRAINSRNGENPVPVGHILPNSATYCRQVADGHLPALIHDTRDFPSTTDIPATSELPIRAHISVPLLRSDGSTYGMFCCLSSRPQTGLNKRDVEVVRLFSELAARPLNQHLDRQIALQNTRDTVSNVVARDCLKIHLQPIVSLRTGKIRAVEALSRIAPTDQGKSQRKDVRWWFKQANSAKMQIPFELHAIITALQLVPDLPPKCYLSVNISPKTLTSPKLREVLDKVPPDSVFLELTEHEEITETDALIAQLDWLRARQIGIAIDDLGAGYSGLSTMLKLRPNVIKLDRALVQGIDQDQVKQSLVRAILDFATQQDAFMIAEGVETDAEHRTLVKMGVRLAQGFLYARPAPAATMLKAMHDNPACPLPSHADP